MWQLAEAVKMFAYYRYSRGQSMFVKELKTGKRSCDRNATRIMRIMQGWVSVPISVAASRVVEYLAEVRYDA